jgi:hypothetical protein
MLVECVPPSSFAIVLISCVLISCVYLEAYRGICSNVA